jgi:hypothetical protein
MLPEELQREIASLVIPKNVPEPSYNNRNDTDKYVTLSFDIKKTLTKEFECNWNFYHRNYRGAGADFAPMDYIVDVLPPADQSDQFTSSATRCAAGKKDPEQHKQM